MAKFERITLEATNGKSNATILRCGDVATITQETNMYGFEEVCTTTVVRTDPTKCQHFAFKSPQDIAKVMEMKLITINNKLV